MGVRFFITLSLLSSGVVGCQPGGEAGLASSINSSNPMAKVVSDKYSKGQIEDCAHVSLLASNLAREDGDSADVNAAQLVLRSVFTGAYFLETGELMSLQEMAAQSSLYDVVDTDMMRTGDLGEGMSFEDAGKYQVCPPLFEEIFSGYEK